MAADFPGRQAHRSQVGGRARRGSQIRRIGARRAPEDRADNDQDSAEPPRYRTVRARCSLLNVAGAPGVPPVSAGLAITDWPMASAEGALRGAQVWVPNDVSS
jgi:hypothetical protein